jgi:hypothetical protein
MKKHGLLSVGMGRGLYLVVLCLLIVLNILFPLTKPVHAAPSVIAIPLPSGQVGSPYTATLLSTPLTCPPCSWAVASGIIPPGLNFNAAAGVISGTPTTAGTYNFMVTVTDATGTSPQQGFFIIINQTPLKFLTTSLSSAKEGVSYTDSIKVSGGTTPYIFAYSGSLPSGLSFNASSGYIAGIPDKGTAGSYSITVDVSDSSPTPLTATTSFTLSVEKGGYDAVITIGSGLKAGQTRVSSPGGLIATLRGGESTTISLDLGVTRAISVDATIPNPTQEGVRYKAEETSIVVSEGSPDATFNYYSEYSIDIKTDPSKVGQLSGSGWYKEGYTLRTSAPDQVNDTNTPGIQYRFAYWKLPTGETVSTKDLSLMVSAAGSCTAYYDTYYLLTIVSPYGEAADNEWYKAGSEAKWSMKNTQVKIQGILGIFGGKLNAVNSTGTTMMDSPKTVTIDWQPDYTMPFIMIPLTIVLLILGGYGLYLLLRSLQPKPAAPPPPYYPYMPPPPPPQPVQPPQTTVVMIGGDKPKLGPATTREQLMEKFGELLQKYEDEIKSTTAQLPGAQTVGVDKRLPAPGAIPPAAEAAEAAAPHEESTATCNYSSKRALRVIVGNWRQVETRTAKLPKGDKKTAEEMPGIAITWARDIFQEWEILNCWLPRGHKEPHEGSVEIVYSLMNTVNEEKTYAPGQELEAPAPHYTDGMPQVDISDREVVPPEKLPPETAS